MFCYSGKGRRAVFKTRGQLRVGAAEAAPVGHSQGAQSCSEQRSLSFGGNIIYPKQRRALEQEKIAQAFGHLRRHSYLH